MYKIIGADGKEYGPVTAEILRQWVAEGRANAQTRVLPPGATVWKTLGELPEFGTESAGVGAVPGRIGPVTTTAGAPTNTLAVVGLVLGIISVAFSLCCYGLPFNLAGVVVSALALTQIRAQNQQGRGLAIAGLVLSLASLLIGVAMLALGVARMGNPIHRIHRL